MSQTQIDRINTIVQLTRSEVEKKLNIAQLESMSEQWYEDKIQRYHSNGAALIDQFERNAIYFVEATGSTCLFIARYLVEGEPKVSTIEQIQNIAQYVGMELPRKTVKPQIEQYLWGLIDDEPETFSDYDWTRIRNMRNDCLEKNDPEFYSDYIDEIASICKIFKVATVIADNIYMQFLNTPQYGMIASELNINEVFQLVWDDVSSSGGMIMGFVYHTAIIKSIAEEHFLRGKSREEIMETYSMFISRKQFKDMIQIYKANPAQFQNKP